jgi:hypothetical protein
MPMPKIYMCGRYICLTIFFKLNICIKVQDHMPMPKIYMCGRYIYLTIFFKLNICIKL